jgi:HEPN domain-containing protein
MDMKKEVKNWLEQAEHDLEVAEYNLDGNMLDAAAFYSQQAAEKALKSLYISKFNELWKVHDLVRIAKRIHAPANIIELCAKITPAYTTTRYPDVGLAYDREDVEETLMSAKEILKWVKKNLNL